MGKITAHNDIIFEPSSKLFSKIKRDLKTYTQVGLIDENDFHDYVMDVLDQLGIGGLIEEDAVLSVSNSKTRLPENYKTLDSIYHCKISNSDSNKLSSQIHPQNGYVFYTDTTYQNSKQTGCDICCDTKTSQRVTVREYIEGLECIHNFDLTRILTRVPLSPYLNPNHVAFDHNFIHTGFTEGELYMKYYAYPLDVDSGLPLIPNVKSIQLAIEFYIKYNLFLNWYWNDEVPNGIAQKAAEAKRIFDMHMKQARYESKHPTFLGAVDSIRASRHSKDIYHQTDRFL